jgi:hypothetical protein
VKGTSVMQNKSLVNIYELYLKTLFGSQFNEIPKETFMPLCSVIFFKFGFVNNRMYIFCSAIAAE